MATFTPTFTTTIVTTFTSRLSTSKGTITPTVVSSFAYNPLTTTFSRPQDCSSIYSSNYLFGIDLSPSCMPSSFTSNDVSFYFSPGLMCPSGYVNACQDHTGVASITTITCCPTFESDVTLSCVTTSTLQGAWSTLFCTWIAPGIPGTSLPVVTVNNGITSAVEEGFTSAGGLNAFGVRMVYQSSDLETTSSTSSLSPTTGSRTTTVTTSSASGSGTPGTVAVGGSSGMSSGAKIAVGVVIPVVVLALIGGLCWFWRRQRGANTNNSNIPGKESRQELPGHPTIVQGPPGELEGDSRMYNSAVELPPTGDTYQ